MPAALPTRCDTQREGGFVILVLEHHPAMAHGLQRYLEFLGHEVQITTRLATAWQAMGARHYDVLLADCFLPDGLCINLLQEGHPRLPRFVATMSAFELDDLILRDLSVVRRHFLKPFAPEDLETLLDDWASERAADLSPA